MYWTLELASKLEDAPWPATKDELIDYAIRSGAPLEVLENLQEIEDEGDVYDSIEDIWPDYPTKDDFLFNEDEYWFTQTADSSFIDRLSPLTKQYDWIPTIMKNEGWDSVFFTLISFSARHKEEPQ